jgi:hypothetical protein
MASAEGETEMNKVAVISVNAAAAPAEHKKAQASLSEIFSFADKTDCILIFFGVIGAGVNGAAMPVFSIFFGDILDSVGEQGAHSKPMKRLRPHDDSLRSSHRQLAARRTTICCTCRTRFWRLRH